MLSDLPIVRHGQSIPHLLDSAIRLTQIIIAGIFKWRRRIRGRYELLSLDERDLWDIGMTRPDAKFEANKRFWYE
jgi:uncharacterized protein YjiS (DUF1127 family)